MNTKKKIILFGLFIVSIFLIHKIGRVIYDQYCLSEKDKQLIRYSRYVKSKGTDKNEIYRIYGKPNRVYFKNDKPIKDFIDEGFRYPYREIDDELYIYTGDVVRVCIFVKNDKVDYVFVGRQ